jgi:hypothetical protein
MEICRLVEGIVAPRDAGVLAVAAPTFATAAAAPGLPVPASNAAIARLTVLGW